MSTIYTDPPQSRNEAIVRATIDGTQYTAPPQSRMEDLLLELKEAIEQGGGGGTTVVANPEGEATDDLEKLQVGNDIYEIPQDYENLDNKPQINSVTLSGNKTPSDLGLQPTLDGAQTVEGNPLTVTDAEPMNAESVVVELEPKQDLHGYDAPWVGGAGKNLIKITPTSHHSYVQGSGIDFTINDNGTIVANGTSSGVSILEINPSEYSLGGNTEFIVNGCLNGGDNTYYLQYNYMDGGEEKGLYQYNDDVTVSTNQFKYLYIIINDGVTVSNLLLEPMIRLSTETDADFEPYSNICPISGYSEVNVENNSTTYTVSLGGTKYGGILDVTSGVLTVTHGEIASYAGETLPSEWISDRDEYQAGTTPTTGAQVVYELATPTSVSTTPTDITLLETTNSISSDGTNIQLKYQPNNVIGECKAYTDEQVQKVLPTPPTTDGTYHLECSVSGGIPTIRWVANS